MAIVRERRNQIPNRNSKFENLLQPSFIKLDQIEVSLDILPSFPACFLQEMQEPLSFCRGIWPARDHSLIPMLDFIGRMAGTVLGNPIQDGGIIIQPIHRFFKGVWIQFEEREEMLIEPDGL